MWTDFNLTNAQYLVNKLKIMFQQETMRTNGQILIGIYIQVIIYNEITEEKIITL